MIARPIQIIEKKSKILPAMLSQNLMRYFFIIFMWALCSAALKFAGVTPDYYTTKHKTYSLQV